MCRALLVCRVVACLVLLVPSSEALSQSVPDSIMADGVPEVPRELVEQLNRYQNMRSACFRVGWPTAARC